jgi:Arc/MetJ-type ribon-helix-helix transcriptional regulator
MGQAPRDQVVMVRVDEETCKKLDSWVESGAVKSRSEAAALFIREGLKVREAELEQLEDALRELEKAKSRLRAKASRIFDSGDGEGDGGEG